MGGIVSRVLRDSLFYDSNTTTWKAGLSAIPVQ